MDSHPISSSWISRLIALFSSARASLTHFLSLSWGSLVATFLTRVSSTSRAFFNQLIDPELRGLVLDTATGNHGVYFVLDTKTCELDLSRDFCNRLSWVSRNSRLRESKCDSPTCFVLSEAGQQKLRGLKMQDQQRAERFEHFATIPGDFLKV